MSVGIAYRLGLDVGTNSIGWCIVEIDKNGTPASVGAMGVRIFGDGRDPQTGASLAEGRRGPRQQRRRRDRFLRRQYRVMALLIEHGLMPKDDAARKALEALDPYKLRAEGLDRALTPHEFGRALFHLNQRRGFQSNRKTDGGNKDEKSGMKAGIAALGIAIQEAGARSYGEYLYKTAREGRNVRAMLPVRARSRMEKNKAVWDAYPTRAMYCKEFSLLWTEQAKFNPALTEAARNAVAEAIFHQRPLKPVPVGFCALEPRDERAPTVLPSSQQFRMLQELNNLKLVRMGAPPERLSQEQRDSVLGKLSRTKEMTFEQIRKLLKLPASVGFNLEDEKRSKLKGDTTGALLSKKDFFDKAWWDKSLAEQDAIVEFLLAEPSEAKVAEKAVGDWGLSEDAADDLADLNLPVGYGRIGRIALGKLLPIMRDQGLGYSDAAAAAGYDHSDLNWDGTEEKLPYYPRVLDRYVGRGSDEPTDPETKRYGRIANPTVHIGLNQLRKIVNALIATYGKPAEIVVELARELKLTYDERQREQKKQADNQKANEARRAKLAEQGIAEGGEAMMRLRLWEELGPAHDRRCVYTGEQISIERLFKDDVEIEHILPFRRTLDNSAANRTVSLRRANRDKKNDSPHEAFGHDPGGYKWEDILRRAQSLPKNKRWRFEKDAMERFEAQPDKFLARQLTDTQYLSRVTREYLTSICPPNKVWVTPGRLTGLMRGKWGLNHLLADHNQKNRTDHRHHAIDAFVTAVTTRSLLQRVASAADQDRDRLIEKMPDPFSGFREQIKAKLETMIVAHRADHGIEGRLHEDTAYGIVKNPDKEGGATLVYRKALADLNPNEIERIRDAALREEVKAHVAHAMDDATARKKALSTFKRKPGKEGGEGTWVRHVRLTKVESGFVPIADRRTGQLYKAVVAGENHHIDIIELKDGRWRGEAVSVFSANQAGVTSEWQRKYPDARLVMRLHKGDMLALNDEDGIARVKKVVRLREKAQQLMLASHNEGGEYQKRHDEKDDSFQWDYAAINKLKSRHARSVRVDELGRIHAVGSPP